MKRTIVVAAVAALAVSACASNRAEEPGTPTAPEPAADSGSAVTPGSVADFQRLGYRVFFDFDSFALRSDTRDALTRQARWLQQYPGVSVRIEGNCDERGTREYNLALGERRASAARDFLVSQGIQPSRITVVSYGKERPLDTGSNDRAYQLNRNATTVILSGAVG
jgi:peptidoglycan-associated lipoprotein